MYFFKNIYIFKKKVDILLRTNTWLDLKSFCNCKIFVILKLNAHVDCPSSSLCVSLFASNLTN